MPIFQSSVDYRIIAFGGAGGGVVKELQRLGFPHERMFYVDTDKDDLNKISLSNKIWVGKSETNGKGTAGRTDIAVKAFTYHQELFENLALEDAVYIIVGGMSGGVFGGMATAFGMLLHKHRRTWIAVSVMPNDAIVQEKARAYKTLERLGELTDKVLLFVDKWVIKQLNHADGYDQVNKSVANNIQKILSEKSTPVLESNERWYLQLYENIQRIHAYVHGFSWHVTTADVENIHYMTNQIILQAIGQRNEDVFVFSTRKFEEVIGTIYRKGGDDVEVTPPTRDGGVDIIVKTMPALKQQPYINVIQARLKEKGKIGRPEVQQLEGARVGLGAHRATFVSSVDFSKDSIIYAKSQKIDLIKFFDLMEDYNRLSINSSKPV